MWTRKLWLFVFCLLLLSVSLSGLSDLQDQIIESLITDLTQASKELTKLKSQRADYRQQIQDLSKSLKKNELSEANYKKQVTDLNSSIKKLDGIIKSKEKLLIALQAEILELTTLSTGLKSDLTGALKISKGLNLDLIKWKIVAAGEGVLILALLIYMAVDNL